jgi:hypothetical protein
MRRPEDETARGETAASEDETRQGRRRRQAARREAAQERERRPDSPEARRDETAETRNVGTRHVEGRSGSSAVDGRCVRLHCVASSSETVRWGDAVRRGGGEGWNWLTARDHARRAYPYQYSSTHTSTLP